MTDPKKARCWDKSWKYVPKDATDIAATFRRIRKQMAEETRAKPAKPSKVQPIARRA